MRPKHNTPTRRSAGFTISEMIVTVAIIVVLIGLSIPAIRVMQAETALEAGQTVVGMSAEVARQWVEPEAWEPEATDDVMNESYTGTAAIYAPTGEVRLVANSSKARATSGTPEFLEDREPALNGYLDINGLDYINIPNNVGIVGIRRDAGSVEFIAPPFAIAFDGGGHLFHGDADGLIYYDSNGDGLFDVDDDRPNDYNPREWDGESTGARNLDVISPARPVKALPFEAIETVAGVVIYSTTQFNERGFGDSSGLRSGGAAGLSSQAGIWFREEGVVLFFSPHTGIMLRDEVSQ